jgi:hypothetical protein
MARKKDTGVYTYGNYAGHVLIFRNGLPYSIRTDDWDFARATEEVARDHGVRLEYKSGCEDDLGGHWAVKIKDPHMEAYEFKVWVNEVDLEHMRETGEKIKCPSTPLRGKRYL